MQMLRTVASISPAISPGLFLAAGLALAIPPAETALRDREHEDVGKALNAYFEKRRTLDGLSDAEEELEKVIAKVEKKLEGEGGLLAAPEDLGRAMWFSQDYAGQDGIKKGRVEPYQATSPWAVEYALHAPKRYNPKEALPLVLIMDGGGVPPAELLAKQWLGEDVRGAAILAAVPLPTDQALWTERGSADAPGGGGNLRIVYGQVKDMYAIDFDRVFLVGQGGAAAAALHIAAESPDFFAGVVARGAEIDDALAPENFKNLPVFLTGGGDQAKAFADKAGKATQGEDDEAAIWAWAKDLVRTSLPTEITFRSAKPYVNKAYWIEFPPSDGAVEVDATVDRETNTVTIRAKGAESVTLLLNDRIVDLSKPVKVTCNGASHEDEIPRNLGTTLDLMWTWRSDPGKVFVARKAYDAPVETN